MGCTILAEELAVRIGSELGLSTRRHGDEIRLEETANGAGLPILERLLELYRPDLLMISAGFDAHQADPLANMLLTTEDFHWITAGLCAVARRQCGGRVVSTLEGGYDLEALAASAAAHVTALMESSR